MAKTPVQDRSRERVSRMLSSFAELLDEVGYDNVSTTMVAARSGSAIGSVYQFFRNKDELTDALRGRMLAEVVELAKANLQGFINEATKSKKDVTLVTCLVAMHHAIEELHRKTPGASHVKLRPAELTAELIHTFAPHSGHDDEVLYSYVLVGAASSIACCEAAFNDPQHGPDILGLCQWSLQELGKEA